MLLDTNILVEIWRGKTEPKKAIEDYSCGIETVVSCEFLQGVNHRQRERAKLFIEKYEFIAFSPEVSYRAVSLIKEFAHSKGLRIADALIASTALERDTPLFTYNKKHFNFIGGLRLI